MPSLSAPFFLVLASRWSPFPGAASFMALRCYSTFCRSSATFMVQCSSWWCLAPGAMLTAHSPWCCLHFSMWPVVVELHWRTRLYWAKYCSVREMIPLHLYSFSLNQTHTEPLSKHASINWVVFGPHCYLSFSVGKRLADNDKTAVIKHTVIDFAFFTVCTMPNKFNYPGIELREPRLFVLLYKCWQGYRQYV